LKLGNKPIRNCRPIPIKVRNKLIRRYRPIRIKMKPIKCYVPIPKKRNIYASLKSNYILKRQYVRKHGIHGYREKSLENYCIDDS
jgi:hypothetical protein